MLVTPTTPDELRRSLRDSADALQRCQAHEIPGALIDRLVELDWLEWRGGALVLTTTGQNIYRKERALLREEEALAHAQSRTHKRNP